MAISAVMVANIYTGFSATAWTAWVFFAVFIGIVIVWLFTVWIPVIAVSRPSDKFTDHLLSDQPRIRCHRTIRKLLLSFHLGILLAVHPPHLLPLTGPTLLGKGLDIRILSRRSGHHALDQQERSISRPCPRSTCYHPYHT